MFLSYPHSKEFAIRLYQVGLRLSLLHWAEKEIVTTRDICRKVCKRTSSCDLPTQITQSHLELKLCHSHSLWDHGSQVPQYMVIFNNRNSVQWFSIPVQRPHVISDNNKIIKETSLVSVVRSWRLKIRKLEDAASHKMKSLKVIFLPEYFFYIRYSYSTCSKAPCSVQWRINRDIQRQFLCKIKALQYMNLSMQRRSKEQNK